MNDKLSTKHFDAMLELITPKKIEVRPIVRKLGTFKEYLESQWANKKS